MKKTFKLLFTVAALSTCLLTNCHTGDYGTKGGRTETDGMYEEDGYDEADSGNINASDNTKDHSQTSGVPGKRNPNMNDENPNTGTNGSEPNETGTSSTGTGTTPGSHGNSAGGRPY